MGKWKGKLAKKKIKRNLKMWKMRKRKNKGHTKGATSVGLELRLS